VAVLLPEQRFDFSRLASKSVERLPAGGARVPANLGRTGILEYRRADGSVRRELVTPEVLFSADSLASLDDAPVLEGHPAMVTPENWGKYTRGHVSAKTARQDGAFLSARLAIQDSDTLAKADSGEICEISLGYTCKIDKTPGVFEGQRYDCRQTDRVYNHVGLGGKNWGRAGPEVALRFDGAAYLDDSLGPEPRKEAKMKVRFDGKEYEAGSNEHVLAMCEKVDSQARELADERKARETADGQVAGLKAENAKLKADLIASADPKRLDAAVKDRCDLVLRAAPVLGQEFKFDGKSELEILTAVAKAADPATDFSGKSLDYLRGRFDIAVASEVRADSIDAIPGRIKTIAARVDAGQEKAEKESRDRKAAAQNAMRTPHFDATVGGGK
jgi:hypothetical protein